MKTQYSKIHENRRCDRIGLDVGYILNYIGPGVSPTMGNLKKINCCNVPLPLQILKKNQKNFKLGGYRGKRVNLTIFYLKI